LTPPGVFAAAPGVGAEAGQEAVLVLLLGPAPLVIHVPVPAPRGLIPTIGSLIPGPAGVRAGRVAGILVVSGETAAGAPGGVLVPGVAPVAGLAGIRLTGLVAAAAVVLVRVARVMRVALLIIGVTRGGVRIRPISGVRRPSFGVGLFGAGIA